jgi:hypothetical protein
VQSCYTGNFGYWVTSVVAGQYGAPTPNTTPWTQYSTTFVSNFFANMMSFEWVNVRNTANYFQPVWITAQPVERASQCMHESGGDSLRFPSLDQWLSLNWRCISESNEVLLAPSVCSGLDDVLHHRLRYHTAPSCFDLPAQHWQLQVPLGHIARGACHIGFGAIPRTTTRVSQPSHRGACGCEPINQSARLIAINTRVATIISLFTREHKQSRKYIGCWIE